MAHPCAPEHDSPKTIRFGWAAALLAATLPGAIAQAPAAGDGAALTLAGLVRRVVERNESVQGKLLEFEVNRRRQAAERGVFEPEGFVNFSRDVTNRQNSTREAAATGGVSIFHERNNLYATGVEMLAPTGGRVRMGYTLSDLHNNIPPGLFQAPTEGNQFQSFAGLSLTQPLLKNFGRASSMAGIRLAALSSNIAFQEYRRQLMSIVGSAEATYWSLHLAQEQVRFFEESLRTAETILRDNGARLDAGKVSELDVLEAQAGVGLRRARLNEARQKLTEAVARVVTLYAEPVTNALPIRAVDVPALDAAPELAEITRQQPLATNPDVLIQREKIQQELVRLAYARNQRLPELNLKGTYGLNGLGETPSDSLSYLERTSYPSWSFGVEVRMPLLGNARGRNDARAAELRRRAAAAAIRSLEIDILNGLSTAAHKVEQARSSVASYQDSVNYNQSLLTSALARLDAGKIESRKVLEIEADLFEARNSVVESLVRYKIARLELELIAGTLLQNRQLEITQEKLQAATEKLTSGRKSTEEDYDAALRRVQSLYPLLDSTAAPAAAPRSE